MANIELLDTMTSRQKSEFSRFREKWLKIGESTEPIDKEKAREAILKCYDLALDKLPRPNYILFVQSPFQLFYARPIWNRMADTLKTIKDYRELMNNSEKPKYNNILWYQPSLFHDEWLWGLRFRAMATIVDEIILQAGRDIARNWFDDDLDAFYQAVGIMQKIWLDNYTQLFPALIEEAREERGSEIYGQNETWLCFYEFMEWAGCGGLEQTHGLQELANYAGWWIPYDNIAVVSDRPNELHLDNEGRLHNHSGVAISFRDGWCFYASHGMDIPSWIIEHPEQITADKINSESNVEVRRVMLEVYGIDKYFNDDANCQLIDADQDFGYLYMRSQEDDEDIYMLKLLNSTPEEDGTRKTYIIRVPPTMKTARQANAWSYGFDNPNDYNPTEQS